MLDTPRRNMTRRRAVNRGGDKYESRRNKRSRRLGSRKKQKKKKTREKKITADALESLDGIPSGS
ncbi:hypothetical protein RUM43_009235 [Polyplax serrata]|uniref:Uncharacterized protein n=1 Tax=Polyplax serrata TaxID=468196 RepID=A0AAN8PAI0_POLSC